MKRREFLLASAVLAGCRSKGVSTGALHLIEPGRSAQVIARPEHCGSTYRSACRGWSCQGSSQDS